MLIVYDGVNSNNERSIRVFHELFFHFQTFRSHNFPWIKSAEIVMTCEKTSDVLINMRIWKSMSLPISPWTLEEYYLAIRDDQFFGEVKEQLTPPGGLPKDFDESDFECRKALIDAKCPIAGNCARLMFDLTYEAAREYRQTIMHVRG